MLAQLERHPQRGLVAAEIHARPVPTIDGPASVVYLAFMKDPETPNAGRQHLADFLEQLGAPSFRSGDACYYQQLEGAELRWESHQEFCSCLLIMPQPEQAYFPVLQLPHWWTELLSHMPGQLINGARMEIRAGEAPADPLDALPRDVGTAWVMGSRVVDGLASVWTSFTQDDDGLTRFLVFNEGLSPFQAGRTCQRLIESDTYRNVALLGFPLAREVWPDIHRLDHLLGEHTARITEQAETSTDQALLDELTALSTRIERLRARTSFRFSASRAYAEICLKRLGDLRETRWRGTSSMIKFVERRFLPAMQTCTDADRHLRELSERIGQATALLRTRVELNQELQNQKLLDAINRRGELQIRLQQVVEGLSVIAITYYLAGLVKLILEGQAFIPGWLSVPGAKLAAIAALAVVVSLYIRRRKKRLFQTGDEEEGEGQR